MFHRGRDVGWQCVRLVVCGGEGAVAAALAREDRVRCPLDGAIRGAAAMACGNGCDTSWIRSGPVGHGGGYAYDQKVCCLWETMVFWPFWV
jgi:hypothetical protein